MNRRRNTLMSKLKDLMEQYVIDEDTARKLLLYNLNEDEILELVMLDNYSKKNDKAYKIEAIEAIFDDAQSLVNDCGKGLIEDESSVNYEEVASEIIDLADNPFISNDDTYSVLSSGKIVRFSVDPSKRFVWNTWATINIA
jgi:hypothetical protein